MRVQRLWMITLRVRAICPPKAARFDAMASMYLLASMYDGWPVVMPSPPVWEFWHGMTYGCGGSVAVELTAEQQPATVGFTEYGAAWCRFCRSCKLLLTSLDFDFRSPLLVSSQRCMYTIAVEVGKMLPVGFVSCKERLRLQAWLPSFHVH